MMWPAPAVESVDRTIIQDDTTTGKRTAQRSVREKEAKIGVRAWMWWTDGSHSDHGRVGAAAVCNHGNQWRSRRSVLGTGRMEVFDAELWAIGLVLGQAIEKRETLQRHGVKTVAIFWDSQTAIRRAAHMEPGPGQPLARRINRRVWELLAQGIATEIHWVPGHSGIPRNEEADCQSNLA
jgi:ribonuclease HI